MNENAQIKIYSNSFISDGMGGGEYKETYYGSINC